MITTEFYSGQGLGNQLWMYAIVRTIAQKSGFEWGIQSPRRFKGKTFLKLDMGKRVFGLPSSVPSNRKPLGIRNLYFERQMIHGSGNFDVTPFQKTVFEMKDKTKLFGVFQSEDYVLSMRSQLTSWFKAETFTEVKRNTCYIHFRGGDFAGSSDLLLGESYYRSAIQYVQQLNPYAIFKIITNDTALARKYFPEIEIESNYHDGEIQSGPSVKLDLRIGEDFSKLQNADYLILSNSSFSWWAAWTNQNVKAVIAPKYWARHNLNNRFWSTGSILTRGWIYVSATGEVKKAAECFEEDLTFKNSKEYLENVRWVN